jgi:hypothetical protein
MVSGENLLDEKVLIKLSILEAYFATEKFMSYLKGY